MHKIVELSPEPLVNDEHAGVLDTYGENGFELVSVIQRPADRMHVAFLRLSEMQWTYAVRPLNGSPESQVEQINRFEEDGWLAASVLPTFSPDGAIRGYVVYLKSLSVAD